MNSIRYGLFTRLAHGVNESLINGTDASISVYRGVYNKIIELVPDGEIIEELLARREDEKNIIN